MQRHHVLPRQILLQAGLRAMIDRLGEGPLGFHDFRRNGLLLPATEGAAIRTGLPLHRGPHGHYNALVLERVGQVEATWQAQRRRHDSCADMAALMRLDLLQRALRRRLLRPPRPGTAALHRRDPALDYAHLDAMADMLWADAGAG